MGDANMIRGYRKAGEFYKIYEKTNRRVRLECTMAISALSVRRGGRVFRDEDDFRRMLAATSAQVAPEFNHILRDERSEFDDHGSPAELISLLNPILRRHHPAEVQRVYEALMRHGRLTLTELSGASLQRLVQAGVLHHSARGIYIIAPRYARALRAFSAVDRRWQRQVMTQDPLPANSARQIVRPLPGRERPRTPLRRVVPRRPQQTFANSDCL